jgi:hypothetical protein
MGRPRVPDLRLRVYCRRESVQASREVGAFTGVISYIATFGD